MVEKPWRERLADSAVTILILAKDFYGSTGEDTLKEAIRLNKPVILIRADDEPVPTPEDFSSYEGKKALITATLGAVAAIQVKGVLESWGFEPPGEVTTYQWEER